MQIQARLIARAVACALGVVAAPALAQQAQKVEKIEVTGSNIKRLEGETALPVQVVTRADIEKTGATTVEQYLQTLSVALSNNNNVAANNSPLFSAAQPTPFSTRSSARRASVNSKRTPFAPANTAGSMRVTFTAPSFA